MKRIKTKKNFKRTKINKKNKKGFDTLKKYFKTDSYKSSNNATAYTSDDFEFIEIDNN